MASTSHHVLQEGMIKDAVGRREEYNRRPNDKNLNTEKILWILE